MKKFTAKSAHKASAVPVPKAPAAAPSKSAKVAPKNTARR